MRIYLDVCCLNRPFDDHSQDRVRLESEAVIAIFNHGQDKNWILLNSEVIDMEISQIPDDDKVQKVRVLSSMLKHNILVDEKDEKRALELEKMGFKSFDSLHIACAEKGKASVFLTTDDGLLNKAIRNKKDLKVRLENPVIWLMEVIEK